LSNIRETDAIVQVVRHFTSSEVVHVEGATDPLRDVSIINTELIFADIQSIEKKIPDLERRLKTNDPEVKLQKAFYERLLVHLMDGKLLIELAD
jgi:ribosome-binding ATPase